MATMVGMSSARRSLTFANLRDTLLLLHRVAGGKLARIGGALFDLGRVNLSGRVPKGQFAVLMPRQMFPIATSSARLDGMDLGKPTRAAVNPSIGGLKLPARGIFAIGGGYFEIRDPDEYEAVRCELQTARS